MNKLTSDLSSLQVETTTQLLENIVSTKSQSTTENQWKIQRLVERFPNETLQDVRQRNLRLSQHQAVKDEDASLDQSLSGALNRIRESVTHDAIINMRAELQQLSQVNR